MTFFGEILDQNRIEEAFLNAYTETGTVAPSLGKDGVTGKVEDAVRETMDSMDWRTEIHATENILEAIFSTFGGYVRSKGFKPKWDSEAGWFRVLK